MINLSIELLRFLRKQLENKDLEEILEFLPDFRNVFIDVDAVVVLAIKNTGMSKLIENVLKENKIFEANNESKFKISLEMSHVQSFSGQELNFGDQKT